MACFSAFLPSYVFCFSNFSVGFESLDLGALSCSLWCYRYLKEDKPHGSAGGLYNFRDLIMEDNPVYIFVPCFLIQLIIAGHGPLTNFFLIIEVHSFVISAVIEKNISRHMGTHSILKQAVHLLIISLCFLVSRISSC